MIKRLFSSLLHSCGSVCQPGLVLVSHSVSSMVDIYSVGGV